MPIFATRPILVTGLSTRAIAESAAQGGHQVVTLDYFGDRDQRSLVENHSLLRDFRLPFSAASLLQASRTLDFEGGLVGVVYISNLLSRRRDRLPDHAPAW